jgi:hypothetical protein
MIYRGPGFLAILLHLSVLVLYDKCGLLEANLVLPLSKLQVPRSSLARPHTSPSYGRWNISKTLLNLRN